LVSRTTDYTTPTDVTDNTTATNVTDNTMPNNVTDNTTATNVTYYTEREICDLHLTYATLALKTAAARSMCTMTQPVISSATTIQFLAAGSELNSSLCPSRVEE
jgi:hypothetical protein